MFVLKLVCGNKELSLLDTWKLAEGGAGFSPSESKVIYSGTMVGGGSRRTNTFMDNQSITMQLRLLRQNAGTFMRVMQDLTSFFNEARNSQEKNSYDSVYLVRRMDSGFSGTVLCGRGDLYYEVLSGGITIPDSAYSSVLLGSNPSLLEVSLNLVCLPAGRGKPAFFGEATGYVRSNVDGDLEIYASGSNIFANPGSEHSTYDTNWAVSSASLVASLETEHVHNTRDTKTWQAVKLTNTGTLPYQYRTTQTLAAVDHNISMYVFSDQSAVSATDCVLYGQSASLSTTFTADSDNAGWYRTSASFTASASSSTHGIQIQPGKSVIIDNAQLGTGLILYPLSIGDQGPGLAFSGTDHNSATVRTGGQYRIRTKFDLNSGYENIFYGGGALSVWCKSDWAGDDGVTHYILDCNSVWNNNNLRLYKQSTNALTFVMYGANSTSKTLSFAVTPANWAAKTDHHIFLKWDKSGPLELWLDGILVDNTTTDSGTWVNLSALGLYVYVGCSAAGISQFDGSIADLRILGPNFAFDSGKTVLDIYRAGRGKTELPFIWTKTLGGILQNTEDAVNSNMFWISGVPGDLEAPLRVFMYNENNAAASMMLSLHKPGQFPYYINVVESASPFYDIGDQSASVSDATRSGSSYIRCNTGTASLASWVPAWVLVKDSRKSDMLFNNYRVFASVRDNSNTSDLFRLFYTTAQDMSNLSGSLAAFSKLSAGFNTVDYVSVSASGAWEDLDFGVFTIPIVPPTNNFYEQQRRTKNISASFVAFGITACNNNGVKVNLDVDRLVFMPQNTMMNAFVNQGYVGVINSIGKENDYLARTSASDISTEETYTLGFVGEWPKVSPRTWVFGNFLAKGLSMSASIKLNMVYQPVFLWGR